MSSADSANRRLCRSTALEIPLRRLLHEAIRDVRADEATLWCLSEDGLRVEAVLNDGPSREIVEAQTVPIDDSVVGLVASSGLGTSLGPGEPHNVTIDRATGVATRAMVAAPVRVRGELFAVLSAINPVGRASFAGPDLETLEWKAYLTGCVLERGASE